MNRKLIYGLALLAVIQLGNAQTTDFYPNDVWDALNIYGDHNSSFGTARSMGMAGSMGALGGDMSAVETNPAGLGVFRYSEANISLGVLSNKNKASLGNSYSSTETNFNLPSAGFVFAVGNDADPLKMNIGVNYSHQTLDNSVFFAENRNILSKGLSQDYTMDGYEQYTDGYKSKMKFSLATNYLNRLYFGIGLDWHYMNVDRSSIYTGRGLTNGGLTSFDEQFSPYHLSANGFGLSVGVIGKVTPEFRLGAAYHSPMWWSDISYDFIGYEVDVNSDVSGFYGYDDRYKITAPGKLVLSGAYASNIINNDNSLAVNFDFVNYFNKDYEFKGDSEYRLNNNFVNRYMENSQEYRAGIEYRYKELKVRAGYSYTSSPVKNNSIAGSFNSGSSFGYAKNYMAGERNKFSVGLGYDMGPFFVDFAYQNLSSDYYTSLSGDFFAPYQNDGVNVVDNATPLFGKVKNNQNNFILTLGVRF